jgi:hypothetical protein
MSPSPYPEADAELRGNLNDGKGKTGIDSQVRSSIQGENSSEQPGVARLSLGV